MRPRLAEVIAALKQMYGAPAPPRITDPWLMIVHENAAYLVDDARRDEVFESLRAAVGLKPRDLLKAEQKDIVAAIARGGMQPERRAQKLVDAAEIASELGDLRAVLRKPEPEAKRALKQFPGIGDPGADRILLFTGTRAVLALDSNGLRVLLRLGFGSESPSYAVSYKSVRKAVADQMPRKTAELIEAYQLLRRHGQELCRRNGPECGSCALRGSCSFAPAMGAAAPGDPDKKGKTVAPPRASRPR